MCIHLRLATFDRRPDSLVVASGRLVASSRRYGDEKQEESWFRQDEAVKVTGHKSQVEKTLRFDLHL